MYDLSSNDYVYCTYLILTTLLYWILLLFFVNFTILSVSLYFHVGNFIKGVSIQIQTLKGDWLEFSNDKKTEDEDLKELREIMLFHQNALEY